MRAIITPAEVSSLARPCYADNEIVLSIIAEAEREDIKPRIGDRLYLSLKKDDTTLLTDEETLLLNGGSWTSTDGAEHYLEGLKTALAYFVYSRIVRDGNIQSTRYGARIKTDDNSTSSEDTERQRQYRQAFSSADRYLTECLGFINQSSTLCGGVVKVMKSNRTRFKVLNGNGADAPSFRSSSASGQLTGDKVIEALGYTPVTPTQLEEVEDEIPDVSNLQEKLTDEQIANINDVPNKASTTYVDNHHDSTKQNTLTETQMQAVNSGITSAKLTTLESHDVVAQSLQLSDTEKATARQNINAEEKRDWKCVFEGVTDWTATTSIVFNTFADGSALDAKELRIQVLMKEQGTFRQGYIKIKSSTNNNLTYYGALTFESGDPSESVPYITEAHIVTSPIFYTKIEYNPAPIRCSVAQHGTIHTNYGGVTSVPQIYEDIKYILVSLNGALTTHPYVKIYAR